MEQTGFDVIIVGGGIVGSSTAFFLASNPDFAGRIAVLERDPTYRWSATCLSASSIRQQFSTAINVRISQYGMEFLRRAHETLAVPGFAASVDLVERSYLYLATATGAQGLARNVALQRGLDVAVELLDRGALADRYPWLALDGIEAGACTSSGEGWFDPAGVLWALRRKAQSLGVTYLTATVAALQAGRDGDVTSAVLEDGRELRAGHFICAAGTRTPGLLRDLGVSLPVEPRRRTVYVFDSPASIQDCPLVIDPSGLWFRPEGRGYISSLSPDPDPAVAVDDFEPAGPSFDDALWPLLAARVPGFEEARSTRSWVGHYDYNVFDQNAFVGPVPSLRNLYIASGFSGHGLQQAPAVGRGLAELIVYGGYRSLDLSPLSFDRYLSGTPLVEDNVI
jgi:glycine/D-amino acid oxidase-like deaminating enzyme